MMFDVMMYNIYLFIEMFSIETDRQYRYVFSCRKEYMDCY